MNQQELFSCLQLIGVSQEIETLIFHWNQHQYLHNRRQRISVYNR